MFGVYVPTMDQMMNCQAAYVRRYFMSAVRGSSWPERRLTCSPPLDPLSLAQISWDDSVKYGYRTIYLFLAFFFASSMLNQLHHYELLSR